MKILMWLLAVILIIGLLTVFGVFKLIFQRSWTFPFFSIPRNSMKNLCKHVRSRSPGLGRNALAAIVIAFASTSAQGQALQAPAVYQYTGNGSSERQELRESDGVHESGIGARVQDMNEPFASSFGLNRVSGALVASVVQGSRAYEAGVQVGDIVLSLDDVAVHDARHLLQLLDAHAPGSIVTAEVWRNPYPVPLKIHLPAVKGTSASVEKAMPVSGRIAGMVLRELSHADLCREGVKSGLLVESVEGPSAAAGIQAGAVILRVNATPLTRIEDFYARLAHRGGREVALLVRQKGQARFVPLAVPQR